LGGASRKKKKRSRTIAGELGGGCYEGDGEERRGAYLAPERGEEKGTRDQGAAKKDGTKKKKIDANS